MYNIAGLNIELKCKECTTERAKKYKVSDEGRNSEFSIITDKEIVRCIGKKGVIENKISHPEDYFGPHVSEAKIFYRQLINEYNGLMLHSSAVVVDDKAYLFSARSGTGKSTHTGKWLDIFGREAYILNDDKPAIRILNDGIYAYGTPWSGKHDISVNKKVELQGICFLERDSKNWIKRIDPISSFVLMCEAILRKIPTEEFQKETDLMKKIIENVPIYSMGCLPNIDAAKMSYETMSK